MTADVADGERLGIGINERIGTITLVKGAVGRMRRGGLHTLGVWAGIIGVGWAIETATASSAVVKGGAQVSGVTQAQLILMVLTAAMTGLGAAIALRLYVEGPRRLLTFDRGLLECAGLMGALTLVFSATQLVYTSAMRGQPPEVVAASAILFMVAYLAGVYALLKLTLWPVCRLTGRTEVGLGAAWRLMRKATRGLLLGYLIFLLPFGVVIAGNWVTLSAGNEPAGLAQMMFLAVGAAYGMACYAMTATIYTLRVENPATVGDVFD